MTQNQALFLQLLPIVALAIAYPVHLYRAAKAEGAGEKSQVTRLQEELDKVKEERDSLKRALRSLGQG